MALPTIKVFPTCFRHLKQDLKSKLKFYPLVEETRPSKWHQRNVVFGRPYVGIFSTNVGRNSILRQLRMRQQNTKATVPLNVVPERLTQRCSRDCGPEVAFGAKFQIPVARQGRREMWAPRPYSSVSCGGAHLTIADALLQKHSCLWFIAIISLVFYVLVHTRTKYKTSTRVHSLYKENSAFGFLVRRIFKDIVRLSV